MSNTRKYAFAIHNLYEADDKFMVHNSYFDPFIVVWKYFKSNTLRKIILNQFYCLYYNIVYTVLEDNY